MLYIFECMINLIFMTDTPLSTTGNPMNINDIGVGALGLLILIVIFRFLVHTLIFYKNKKHSQNEEALAKNIRDRNTSYLISILYYVECYILIFIYMFRGKNTIMKTTKQKPSKNDLAISVALWLYTILVITCIVLISL